MNKRKKSLRKQLELLAERSKTAEDRDLASLSTAMCVVHRELKHSTQMSAALFAVMGLNLLISIVVLIQNFFGG